MLNELTRKTFGFDFEGWVTGGYFEGRCRLGYVPLGEDKDLCVAEEFNGGDDYRLYYRGAELGAIEKDKLYFPDLSHA